MIYSAVLQWSAELTTVECKSTYINKQHNHTLSTQYNALSPRLFECKCNSSVLLIDSLNLRLYNNSVLHLLVFRSRRVSRARRRISLLRNNTLLRSQRDHSAAIKSTQILTGLVGEYAGDVGLYAFRDKGTWMERLINGSTWNGC